jgi:hypothetical protein
MPLYSYRCDCGNETEAANKMAERHTHAPVCHGPMSIKLTPVIGYVQRPTDYKCPVTGKWVSTNRQRTNIMREHNLIDANDFPFTPKVVEQAEARKAKNQQAAADLMKPILIHD